MLSTLVNHCLLQVNTTQTFGPVTS